MKFPDLYMMIAHECRHIWQLHNLDFIFFDYEDSSNLSVKDYNSQFAEVDAWAFTVVKCKSKFGIIPDLKSILSVELWEKIRKRAIELSYICN